MKKRLVLIVFTVLLLNEVQTFAQQKAKYDTLKIETSAICEICKTTIEEVLAFTPGVKKSDLNMETKSVTVIYKPDKTNYYSVCQAIAKAGYDADSVKADIKAYNKLPPCCKYTGKNSEH